MKIDLFSPTPSELFFSRDPKTDPRLGDFAKSNDFKNKSIIIAGYPDDEGIENNGGRTGARDGPDYIRKYLYRMTPPVSGDNLKSFVDIGNLRASHLTLEERHEVVRKNILTNLESGHSWLGLGGGHDFGYPDGSALIEYAHSQKQKPLVINFDAHLDVRPLTDNKINSGTPFYRLLNLSQSCDFLEIGIQSQCNSREHLKWLQEHNGQVLLNDEILISNEPAHITILKFLEPWILKNRLTYLSIDIDAFKSSEAPGCSQSWPLGLSAQDFMKVFNVLRARLDIRVLGLYEVSPSLDMADITSKLAAQIVYQFLRKLG